MDQNNQLLQVAAGYARDIHAHCADVATILFPTAVVPPSDAVINAVSTKLRQTVADIERAISQDGVGQVPKTWEMLTRSGFLREPDLIDHILARVTEDRLEPALGANSDHLLNQLLDHSNAAIAEAAQNLLAAKSLHRHSVGNSYLELPPELLHKLCWRVVAAIELLHGARRPEIIASTKLILSQYSESNRAQAAAQKIVHFSSTAERAALLIPEKAGFHLHIAALAAALDLEHDHVIRLIDSGSATPYAIMLAGAGVSKADAARAIYIFRGEVITLHEAGIFDAGYEALQPQSIQAEISNWGAARTNSLAFGQP